MRKLAICLAAACFSAAAQQPGANYDEAKVPAYTLPAVLTSKSGEPVRNAKDWERRRAEILELYRSQVFGRTPAGAPKTSFEVTSVDRQALGGKAVRKMVAVTFSGHNGRTVRMDLLIYLPAAARRPVPVFVGLGFLGNESLTVDPGVPLADEWVRDPATKKYVRRRAEETARGSASSRWQVEKILAQGYGVATAYYGDIEPDFDGGIPYGIRPLAYQAGQSEPAADEWGAIGAWAYGLSRAMDYLETDHDIDSKHVALIGHSRLGKTALWAGAQDPRFSIVISNDSGEGGAAISRREFGERTKNLNTSFPHWFCGNFKQYNDREADLPVDSHMLLALIAPRPLYVASAQEDLWADPRGEFLGAVNASPVYELLGKKGVGTDRMPGIEQPIMHTVGYHIRSGKHDITAYDWEQYLNFAKMQWK